MVDLLVNFFIKESLGDARSFGLFFFFFRMYTVFGVFRIDVVYFYIFVDFLFVFLVLFVLFVGNFYFRSNREACEARVPINEIDEEVEVAFFSEAARVRPLVNLVQFLLHVLVVDLSQGFFKS